MSEAPKETEDKPTPPPPSKTGDHQEIRAEFDENAPLDGIFAQLNKQFNGNLQARGVLIITASSTLANQPEQIVEPEWKSHWCSDNMPEQWIKIDLKSARITITHYSLKTYNYVAGGNHLRSWVLEGSVNDSDWEEIDRRQSTNDLNDKAKIKSYKVKAPASYRYFKLTQTGKSHCDSDIMALTAIEFFGTYRMNMP